MGMRKISLIIAALLAGSFMLPGQLPNPLNLPDPLGLSRPGPSAPEPYPSVWPEEGKAKYHRHPPKKTPKRLYVKPHKHGH
jgi:hypothetical protein